MSSKNLDKARKSSKHFSQGLLFYGTSVQNHLSASEKGLDGQTSPSDFGDGNTQEDERFGRNLVQGSPAYTPRTSDFSPVKNAYTKIVSQDPSSELPEPPKADDSNFHLAP